MEPPGSPKVVDTAEVTPDQPDQPEQPNPPPDYCVKLFQNDGEYHLLHGHQYQLKNSLLVAVGFFELANAGDFAANVWNQYPVPKYATAFMAIGGTFALCMTYFAYQDARLSWHNLKGLRLERRYLRSLQGRQHSEKREEIRTVKALLDVNHRETGTEIIDRIGMDIFMGFGATMVGVGTLMAIGGAHHAVFIASNLLSGYVGNGPLALYGLVNFMWSIYVWIRAHRHHNSYHSERLTRVDVEPTVGKQLKARIDAVQIHASLNGITGLVAGAASLVTSTMWWGYIVLIPCIVISVIVNYAWRHGLGYDRPLAVESLPGFDEVYLTEELKYIASVRRAFPSPSRMKNNSTVSLSGLVPDPESISSIVDFLTTNDLFEKFCLRLLSDKEFAATVLDLSDTIVTIYPSTLSSVSDTATRRRLIDMARECISELGPSHLKNRERYLLETLGCYLMASPAVKPKIENSAANMV